MFRLGSTSFQKTAPTLTHLNSIHNLKRGLSGKNANLPSQMTHNHHPGKSPASPPSVPIVRSAAPAIKNFLNALNNPHNARQIDRVLPNPNIAHNLRSPSCFSIEGEKLDKVTVFYETQTPEGLKRYQDVAKMVLMAKEKVEQGGELTPFEEQIVNAELKNMTFLGGGGQIIFDLSEFKSLIAVSSQALLQLPSGEHDGHVDTGSA